MLTPLALCRKGKSVQEAKPAIKKWMIEQGMALSYNEPEKEVISRSGVECVVALTDQWYLNYGEPTWRDEIQAHLEAGLETYNPQTHKKFGEIIGWLKEWACSRSYDPLAWSIMQHARTHVPLCSYA